MLGGVLPPVSTTPSDVDDEFSIAADFVFERVCWNTPVEDNRLDDSFLAVVADILGLEILVFFPLLSAGTF